MTIDQIRENSARLRELSQRIHETVQVRGRGPTERARWEEACERFHKSFDELFFPGGSATFERVKHGDPGAVEAAIRFLEADPYHFRSGYHKEYLWRVLSKQQVSVEQRHRLEDAALSYLRRRIGREFWYMCRAMTRISTPGFWERVAASIREEDPLMSKRASYLLAFSEDIHAGAKLQRQVFYAVLREKYGDR